MQVVDAEKLAQPDLGDPQDNLDRLVPLDLAESREISVDQEELVPQDLREILEREEAQDSVEFRVSKEDRD